jgi:glucose/arabinose dehydrogenase
MDRQLAISPGAFDTWLLMRLASLLLAIVVVAGCDGGSQPPQQTPPPPSQGPGSGGESITGRERLGWDQQAPSATEVSTYRYAIYVDGNRSELSGVTCGSNAGAAGFPCSGNLPPMSNGAHTLELAAFNAAGESARSAPLRVTVTGLSPGAQAGGEWTSGPAGDTTDGVRLHAERLLDGFSDPADAAFTPDGRLIVAERAGRVRVINNRPLRVTTGLELDGVPADGGLLAVALAPDYASSRAVFVLAATTSNRGRRVFQVARYREVGGMLAQRAVLLETPAPSGAGAAMRFGPDGMLYVAFGAGSVTPHPSTDMGKLLRLRPDGTTPRDRRVPSPVVSSGHVAPAGLTWRAGSVWTWMADGTGGGNEWIAAVNALEDVPPVVWPIPPSERASSIAAYRGELLPALRGDLLVASAEARQILRLRVDPADPTRIVSSEALLRDHVGPVRVVLEGPDGAIYFLTDTSLGRLTGEVGDRR